MDRAQEPAAHQGTVQYQEAAAHQIIVQHQEQVLPAKAPNHTNILKAVLLVKIQPGLLAGLQDLPIQLKTSNNL